MIDGLITPEFITVFLAGSLVAAVPVGLASLGETISQRTGVLNVGVEGIMLGSAYVGFSVAFLAGSMDLGLVAGAVSGSLFASVLVLLHLRLRLSAIVVGIAMVITAQGLTSFLHGIQYGSTYPRLGAPASLDIPFLADLPIVGRALFSQHVVVYLTVVAALVVWWMFRHTNVGLELRAAGDRPEALDSAGVSVLRTRAVASLVSGAFAGLGGAYISCVSAGVFVPFMTNGGGFIAVMLAMVARERSAVVLLGAALFGMALSLVTSLQLVGVGIPTDLVETLPFVVVLLMLLAGRAALPTAFGRVYVRGDR
ncbi:ABC transporter permease [soil metagenome]